MTEGQAWLLLIEGGVIALAYLLGLLGIGRGPPP